ncbi:MAG: hypothetical protein COY53_02875 [Elusimicrobia bacterium CG_4_10_14_0_8_um_filter_37_32]|nr:MAG: hypothetical protein COS17_00420 [Elusimicrobia bacterium CG02_land_8_20_14_3_00_37_13]PIZ13809.1 MAG: hypothetical protein COY53_02875 [Elusimicrobia bacterium CG_4_10_14_0_8_um_filter_37_32]
MAQQYELSLYDYWRVIRRRKFILFFTFAAVMISTWIFTNMQIQIYQSIAMVKVESTLIVPGVATESMGWDILTALNTEVKIIKSAIVAERVANKLGLLLPDMKKDVIDSIVQNIQNKISASRVGDTNLMQITATSSDRKETAKLANATAEVYIEKGIEDRSRRAKELRSFIGTQLAEAEKKLKESEDKERKFIEINRVAGVGGYMATNLLNLQSRRRDLLKQYTEQHPDVIQVDRQIKMIEEQMRSLPKEELEYARIRREVKLNENLYSLLAQRYKEAEISEADRVQSAFIVSQAVEPHSPIRPNRATNFSAGTLLGIFLGIVFAFIIEHLDTSIGTIEDVETYLQSPVLGIIPHIEPEKRGNIISSQFKFLRSKDDIKLLRSKMIVYHSSRSPFVEAYHTLRTNIKVAKEEIIGGSTCILFTSSGVGEGKTLTALNFSLAASQIGIKTLLIELDLRRPSLHKIFGMQRVPGFTDCLLGKQQWQDVTRGTTDFLLGEIELERLLQTPGIENFKFINCGSIPSNPIDLLGSIKAGTIFSELRNNFELIIIDCSPVLLFADSLILSKYADGVVIVYKVGRIARGALKRARDQLMTVKAKLMGVILNDIKSTEMEPRYGYYYAYRYYSDSVSGSASGREKTPKT